MPSKFSCQLTALALTCLGLNAQNLTVPSILNGVEGGSGTNVPFGSNLACRYQCIYDGPELPWVGPRLISGITIRPDNGSPTAPATAAVPAKGFLNVSVLVSTTHASSSSPSGTFEDNYGVDSQWVMHDQLIQLPAQPVTGPGPRSSGIVLNFTTPWWYGLTPARHNQPAPENLLIEIWIKSQPSGVYPIDNLSGCTAAVTTFGQQGPLCAVPVAPPMSPTPPTLGSDLSMTAGSSFSWFVGNAPADAAFVLAFNATSQGGFLGQTTHTLPYPLFDPQNPSQPSAALAALSVLWSAPDCWINVDPAVSVFGQCDSTGAGVFTSTLPSGRFLVGFELYAQAFIASQTANTLQTISTLGRSSTICGPLGVCRIFAFYNGTGNPTPPPPTSGSYQYGLAPVIQVQ